VHARLGYSAPDGEEGVIAHYTWTLAHDDGDGPFSYRAADDDRRADWARSAGLSPHAVSVVGNVTLGRIAVSAVATWLSSAPYDVTSTVDAAGDGLYDDRAGRRRNSGRGASYGSISVYAHRRVRLPWFGGKGQPVDLLVRAENVLDRTNSPATARCWTTDVRRPPAAMPAARSRSGSASAGSRPPASPSLHEVEAHRSAITLAKPGPGGEAATVLNLAKRDGLGVVADRGRPR
jgi:hypothetical protein